MFGLPLEQIEHVRHQLHDSIEGFHSALGRSRQIDDQDTSAGSRQDAGQDRQRGRFAAMRAHQLAKTGDFAVQDGAGGFGRDIARRQCRCRPW